MTELLRELDAVAGLMSGFDRQRFTAELERWFRTHHAEIAEALKNARRYRAAIQLHKDQFPDDPLTGEITLWAELDIPNSPSTTE